MNILWNIRLYPPGTNAGAEWYAHDLNKYLISKGHTVTVMLPGRDLNYELDGVTVSNYDPKIYRWADLVFTHLEPTDRTIADCRRYGKPVVFIAHNTFDYPMVRHYHDVGVILNSKAALDICGYDQPCRRRMVLPPPIDIDYYKVPRGKEGKITLINLNENKGVGLFYQLAEMMPDLKFLGVRGGYHKQVIKDLPNVEIVPHTPDIRTVYARTSILLMPSRYESWGRTATEAMASGIPVICHPTFGLKENCGDAGIYVDRSKPELWAAAISNVLMGYKKYSKAASARAENLRTDFSEFDVFLKQMISQ